jgi:hypothetical protein
LDKIQFLTSSKVRVNFGQNDFRLIPIVLNLVVMYFKQIITNCDIILAIVWDLEVIQMKDTSIISVLKHNKHHAIKIITIWFMPAMLFW